MNQWKVIFATMVIFGCGVVTGALLMRADRQPVISQPEIPVHAGNQKNPLPTPLQLQRAELLRKMGKQLNLTAEQTEHIKKIMHASQERTKPLWDQIAPQMREEVKKVREEILAELTPDQQKKFEDMLKPRGRKPDSPTNSPPIAQTNQ